MVKRLIQNAIHEYMEQCGRLESEEIIGRIKKSKLFSDNIQIAVQQRRVFRGDTINKIVASSHWKFAFGHKRKIYFASLLFLIAVYEKFEYLTISINEEEFSDSFHDIERSFKKMI